RIPTVWGETRAGTICSLHTSGLCSDRRPAPRSLESSQTLSAAISELYLFGATVTLPRSQGRGRPMIRTGEEYRVGLRDGREVWIDGDRVKDVTIHPAFKPVIDCKARMYDMAHEADWAGTMSYGEGG